MSIYTGFMALFFTGAAIESVSRRDTPIAALAIVLAIWSAALFGAAL